MDSAKCSRDRSIRASRHSFSQANSRGLICCLGLLRILATGNGQEQGGIYLYASRSLKTLIRFCSPASPNGLDLSIVIRGNPAYVIVPFFRRPFSTSVKVGKDPCCDNLKIRLGSGYYFPWILWAFVWINILGSKNSMRKTLIVDDFDVRFRERWWLFLD